ncbi:MAG: thioredoxin family protein [Candidatus Handelsmanbacteria bacterium]|nr:thioredoxin family protein [Candidatus Handelsmanbacteria bacterium]
MSRPLLALLLLALCVPAQGQSHVRTQLLADTERVAPGQPFLLGVRLKMDPGWHTYWAFSGDAGLPTTAEWQLPPGFSAGPLQWPAPHKYTESGDLTVYGYQDEVLLMAQIQPPSTLPPDTLLSFGAAVSWLVCREVCIPGDTTLSLSLPSGRAAPAHPAMFSQYRARVPGPLAAAAIELRHHSRQQDEELLIDLTLTARSGALLADAHAPDFYPLDGARFAFAPPRRGQPEGTRAPGLDLHLSLKPYEQTPLDRLRGVLVYRLEGESEARYAEVDLPLAPQGGVAPGGLLAMDFKAPEAGASLGWFLLLAALGGLLLNLMPCVLPVISLKILGLVSQSGAEAGRVRRLGLAFAGGILASFAGLALLVVALREGGQQLGWGFQFQSPGFVMAMCALVFALGLSLFGVFTVNLPGLGAVGTARREEGGLGSFLNGVLATVLATPCTAPFLGAAMGFAFAQPGPAVLGIFLASGTGMALPYAALALRPGWTRHLPRPGAWMERFKQGMGFLLMGTVLWLLWVLGKQLGVEAVVWTGAFLLGLGFACWIVGQCIDLNSPPARRRLAWALSLLVTGASYGYFLHPLLRDQQELSAAPTQADPGWQPFSVALVESLVGSGRPVFIDFTAEWCWTCKVNERTVLTDEPLRQKFANLDVALLKADWTSRNPEITALLRAFGRSGVPLYVIFPAGRLDQPLVLPEIITPGLVIERLDQAAALAAKPGA